MMQKIFMSNSILFAVWTIFIAEFLHLMYITLRASSCYLKINLQANVIQCINVMYCNVLHICILYMKLQSRHVKLRVKTDSGASKSSDKLLKCRSSVCTACTLAFMTHGGHESHLFYRYLFL